MPVLTEHRISHSSLGLFLTNTKAGEKLRKLAGPSEDVHIYEFDEEQNRYRLSVPLTPNQRYFIDLSLLTNGEVIAERRRRFVEGLGFNGGIYIFFFTEPQHIHLSTATTTTPDTFMDVLITRGYPSQQSVYELAEMVGTQYDSRSNLLKAIHYFPKFGRGGVVSMVIDDKGWSYQTPTQTGKIVPYKAFSPIRGLTAILKEQGSDVYLKVHSKTGSSRLIAQQQFEPITQIAQTASRVGWEWLNIPNHLPLSASLPQPQA